MIAREYSAFYIDGAWRPSDSSETFEVISPRNGEHVGSVPAATRADIDAAVEAARHAFYETDWPTRPVSERAAMLPPARGAAGGASLRARRTARR